MRKLGLTLLTLAMLAGFAQAATYEIGPGKTYENIGDFAWESTVAGDTILIYYRATPYHEKFLITGVGTPSQPITVSGVPGPGGELPILDGQNATTRLALSTGSEARGLITMQRGDAGTIPPTCQPEYIVIENLEIRNASVPYTFTDDSGATQSYVASSAAIWIVDGKHITVRNCYFHDCGNGFFTYTLDSGATNWTEDILLEATHIESCGNAGSTQEHNSYTESMGMVYQYNHYGPPRGGDTQAIGNGLKDRSAGLVVRYNWIEGGNRCVDAIDCEDSDALGLDPSWDTTFLYGNVFIERPDIGNRQVIHFGADMRAKPRVNGYFYNNTLVSYRGSAAETRTTLVRCSNTGFFDVRNCVLYTTADGSQLEITNDSRKGGPVELSYCWMKPGYDLVGPSGGTVNDYDNHVLGTDPGFVDFGTQDFHLATGSGCIGAATTLHVDAASYPVTMQYVKHLGGEARASVNDIGAFESGGGQPADLVISTTSLPDGTVSSAYSQQLSATGGVTPYDWSVISGSLPAGLNLSSGGLISGTPTTEQTANFTVQVTDSQGTPDSDTQALSITINAEPQPDPLVITTTSLPGATVGVAYSEELAATGGVTPYDWSVISGSLPAGLNLSSGGLISGTPTTEQTANFTVQVTDAQAPADSDTQALSISVTAAPSAPTITTTSLPNGQRKVAYSAYVEATGGTTPYAWSVVSGSLPNGLSLNSSSGLISGSPPRTGTFNFTVRCTDSAAQYDEQALSITIN